MNLAAIVIAAVVGAAVAVAFIAIFLAVHDGRLELVGIDWHDAEWDDEVDQALAIVNEPAARRLRAVR